MNGMLRIPRSRGALSGVLLILLGAWGGLIPFIGPYFHYAYTPPSAWSYTPGRFWLEILPAAFRTSSPWPFSVAMPAESYPRYSSRRRAGSRNDTASRSPTYPTIPHMA